MHAALQWDVFCHVVDNHGDLGVSWRLAADLAARKHRVRLHVDDASALRWMAPAGAPGVEVLPWDAGAAVGDVVVETFGCALPPAFVDAMAARRPAPVWVNLEYLSAEDYVERSHRLPSPAAGTRGLGKWFYYPGFTAATGGLLREPGLLERRAAFVRAPWLAAHGIEPRNGERLVSVFAYAPPATLDDWIDAWADRPTLLLLAPGAVCDALCGRPLPPALRRQPLPWLTQDDYDRLLWSCDLNFVRGEDSFVRAQWAGAPFVWHIYPQDDGAHAAKLEAFVGRFIDGAPPALAATIRDAMRQWNGIVPGPVTLPAADAWALHCRRWRDALAERPDLTSGLVAFCTGKLRLHC